MQSLLKKRNSLLPVVLFCLALLAACSGSNPKSVSHTPTPTPTPTAGPGQQLLEQAAHLLSSAQTLHGTFNTTISGPFLEGKLNSEVWRMIPNKSRTLVLKSTLSQFTTGSIVVSDGKRIWQYDPASKVVYTGPVNTSSTISGTPISDVSQGSDGQELIFNIIQNILQHSVATLLPAPDQIDGHEVTTLHVSPQAQSSNSNTAVMNFNYDGTISLDKQTRLPLLMDLTLQGFGHVKLAFSHLELNKPLAADLFTFTAPPGTTTEPFPTSNIGADGNSLTLQQAEQQAGYHLLSIPESNTAYTLQSVDALGAPGSQIYTLTYTLNGANFTISESKALADLPVSGQSLPLRNTTATLATSGKTSTLSWTEKGVGIQISGTFEQKQIVAIAELLA